MCVEAIGWAYTVPGLPAAEKAVLLALAWHRNASTGRCDPSIAALADETSLTRRTVQRALRDLEARELITSAPGGGGRVRSSYALAYRGVTGTPLHPLGGVTVSPLDNGRGDRVTPLGGATVAPLSPLGASGTARRGVTVTPELEGTGIEQEGGVTLTPQPRAHVCPWPHCRIRFPGPHALAEHLHNVHDDEEPW